MQSSIIDAFHRALEEAQLHAGATAPNPPVGCAVLDREGTLLAVAAHKQAGAEHAEALAIRQCREAGLAPQMHTLVVTLEPCNHQGRQPPCTDALLATSVKELWIGAADPNPSVSGGGAERLRRAGLHVHALWHTGPGEGRRLASECERLIAPFSKWVRTGVPWVTVKQAFDHTGSMIPPAGQKTFTSATSLTLAHQLRRRANAILTGSGTVLADQPEFTVRHVADHLDAKRWLVILDRRRRTSPEYLSLAVERGFRVELADDLGSALEFLGRQGDVLEVLVEAGPGVSASTLATNLWDERVVIRTRGEGEPDAVEFQYR